MVFHSRLSGSRIILRCVTKPSHGILGQGADVEPWDIVAPRTGESIAVASLATYVAKWSALNSYLFMAQLGSASFRTASHSVGTVVVDSLPGIAAEPVVLTTAAADFFDVLSSAHC